MKDPWDEWRDGWTKAYPLQRSIIPMSLDECVGLVLGIAWFSGMGWILWLALNQ